MWHPVMPHLHTNFHSCTCQATRLCCDDIGGRTSDMVGSSGSQATAGNADPVQILLRTVRTVCMSWSLPETLRLSARGGHLRIRQFHWLQKLIRCSFGPRRSSRTGKKGWNWNMEGY